MSIIRPSSSTKILLMVQRNLLDQYKQCNSAAEMTETQERILGDLEEAYNESRNAPGVCFLVILEKSELR